MCFVFNCHAQKKTNPLNEQDTAAINNAAKNTIKSLFETLGFITDPSYSPEDKKVFMEKAFTTDEKIFIDRKRAQVEDDHNPKTTYHSDANVPMEAGDYLNILSTSCKVAEGGNNDAAYNINWLSCVKNISGRYIIKVRYSQQFNFIFVDSPSLKYQRVIREADLFAQKTENNTWRTYINSIYLFDTSFASTDNQNCTPISNSLEATIGDTLATSQNDIAHYKYLLEKGAKAIVSKKYIDAYVALKSAARVAQFTKPAKELISRLYVTIAKSGVENPDNYLSDKLQKQAQDYEDIFRYKDALHYYTLAFALSPANNGLSNRIDNLNEKLEQYKSKGLLYTSGLYKQAIDGYQEMLNDVDNTNNPYLYMHMANCYARLFDKKNAEAFYAKAIKLGPDLPEVYDAFACYQIEKKYPDFKKAYESYINELNSILDKEDPATDDVYSKIAYCKGYMLFQNNDFMAAADSLASALKYAPYNAEAQVMLGRCKLETNKKSEAIECFKKAIFANSLSGEAYFWLGISYWGATEEGKDYTRLAIKCLRQAVALKNTNGFYELELGKKLMLHKTADSTTDDFLPEAITCFSKCIGFDSATYQQALIARGECYSRLGRYAEANDDFKFVDTNCLSNKLFYNDLGFMELKTGNNQAALYYFNKNAYSNPIAMLGMGETLYLNNTTNPDKEVYLSWFRKALSYGVAHDLVKTDATLNLLTKGDKSFRKLLKSYGY